MINKRDMTLGVILILIGIGIFLLNTNILPNDIILILAGIGFLVGYYNKRSFGFLIAGLILLAIGIGSLLSELGMTSVDLTGFFFMVALGLVFLVLYFMKGIKGFIYPGCLLPALGVFILLDEIYDKDLVWALFLLLSLAFFAIYLIEYRKLQGSWPLIPGIVLLVIAGLFFLSSEEIISNDFWKIISYIWPVILVIVGGKIIYNNYRYKG